ncbi:MAG: septum formation initiator family protein [Actinomycetota bacterium]
MKRLVATGCVAGIVLGYAGPVRGYLGQRSELARERVELSRLESTRDRLVRRLDALNDPVVLEVVARELGFVRPGERVFFISRGSRQGP